MKHWLMLAGHVFVASVSVIGAFRIEGSSWQVLLILSSIVTLVLAITRMQSSKKMAEKIGTLEENQLSVRYDKEKEALYFEKGVK